MEDLSQKYYVTSNVIPYSPILNDVNTDVIPSQFTPTQIRSAYGLNLLPNQATLGKGITIAIIIAYHYANLQSDLNTYCSRYGLPSTTLNIVNLAGSTSNASWALEECLDVQMVHVMAPYANIIVVEAATNSTTDIWIAIAEAITMNPSVISMSFSLPEYSGIIALDTTFSAASNIAFVAATGDTDTIGYPATSPNVIAAGGSTLTVTATGTRLLETTWTSAGAGPSLFFTAPSYQAGLTSPPTNRNIPDIAMDSNPSTGVMVYSSINGGYVILGGTSLSTPLIAGIIGICNQYRLKAGKPVLCSQAASTSTSFQHYLYQVIYNNLPSNALYTSYMYDITTGSTDNGFSAGVGFDLCTGLGSINVNTIAPSFTSD
jgi:subtilase family serine protease